MNIDKIKKVEPGTVVKKWGRPLTEYEKMYNKLWFDEPLPEGESNTHVLVPFPPRGELQIVAMVPRTKLRRLDSVAECILRRPREEEVLVIIQLGYNTNDLTGFWASTMLAEPQTVDAWYRIYDLVKHCDEKMWTTFILDFNARTKMPRIEMEWLRHSPALKENA